MIRAAREMKQKADAIIRDATAWLGEEARRQGRKTFSGSAGKVVVKGGPEVQYDHEKLEKALRDAGLSEQRIGEVIKTTITYTVDKRVLNQIVGANPDYAKAAESAKIVIDKPYQAEVKGAV